MELLNWREEQLFQKKYLRLLSAVRTGYYPYMIFKKMDNLRLERFVTRLIEYSIDECHNYNGNCVSAKSSKPKWWPKYLKFVIPIRNLKTKVKDRKWAPTLRNVIASCSQFYKVHFFKSVEPEKTFVHSQEVKFLEPHRSTRNREYWIYKYHMDNHNILTKSENINANVNNSKPCINLQSAVKLSPIVKLFDVTKDCERFLQTLKFPKVNLVDILKYPVILRKTKQKSLNVKYKKTNQISFNAKYKKTFPKLTQYAHVRLHNLFEIPKDVHYTKDDFMNYFSLCRSDTNNDRLLTSTKPVLRSVLRNNNIPISSDLGRCVLQSRTILKYQTPWKIQKLEWYLREVPQVRSEQQYSVTFCENYADDLDHTYIFPKRQQYQVRQSLRLYSQLKKCRPVCVKLERMKITTHDCAKSPVQSNV